MSTSIVNSFRFPTLGPATAPIHWWNLDNITTGIEDQGTGGTGDPWAPLTNNGVTAVSSPAAPNGGDCLDIDAADYLNRSDVAWTGSGNDWSVSYWFYTTTFTTSGFGTHIMWADSGASTNGIFWMRDQYNPNKVQSIAVDDDWEFINIETTGLSTSTWYHVVTTWDDSANTGSHYINNGTPVTVTDANVQTLPTATMPFAIGTQANNVTGNRFAGNMWTAGIWDVVLTADDVSDLYNDGNGLQYDGSTWS